MLDKFVRERNKNIVEQTHCYRNVSYLLKLDRCDLIVFRVVCKKLLRNPLI